MVDVLSAVFQRPHFLTFVIIFLWGFYIMVTRYNLVKKLVGMYLVQTSVIFFLVSISAKKNNDKGWNVDLRGSRRSLHDRRWGVSQL